MSKLNTIKSLLAVISLLAASASQAEAVIQRTTVFCANTGVAYWFVHDLSSGHISGMAVDQNGNPLSCEAAEQVLNGERYQL